MLAGRYADDPTVIGADLHNEPHAGTWGGGGPTDWAAAAERAGNAIGAVNPNWLIFVEGVATYQGQPYWWGGNLMGVRDRPIDLNLDNKLVYSAHDYPNSVWAQPWFQGSDFPANLPAKFDQMWGYIYKEGIAPVYIGEFGTNLTDPKDAPWLEAITSYLAGDLDNNGTTDIPAGDKGVSWTFWSWNPNSGDTGGILANDWRTVNQDKMAYLTPIEFDFDSDVSGGGSSGPHATFLVTLSAPATGTVTVDYHTVAGTAGSADFTGIERHGDLRGRRDEQDHHHRHRAGHAGRGQRAVQRGAEQSAERHHRRRHRRRHHRRRRHGATGRADAGHRRCLDHRRRQRHQRSSASR